MIGGISRIEFTYHFESWVCISYRIYDSKALLGVCFAGVRLGVLPLLDSIILSSGVTGEIDMLIYQVILNIQRKSVVGLSVDFVVLNVRLAFKQANIKILGFTFYSIYNVLVFSSAEIHEQYHRRHPNSDVGPLVQVNDVFFAIHAAVISTFTLTQIYCWGYTRSERQFPSSWTWGIVVGSSLAIVILSCVVAASDGRVVEWLDVCYAFSYVKLLCTFIKYVPQVCRSTSSLTLRLN